MRTALLLFAFGLVLRLLLWLPSPDAGAAWHVAFQGDAPVWQDLAHKAAAGLPDELLRLPLRPPGMHWLVSSLWDGDPATAWRLRLVFAVLGATLAPLLYLLVRRHLTASQAGLAGIVCAAAQPLLLLSSGLHSETPYLALCLLAMFDQERLRTRGDALAAGRWGLLHGALILLRTEHLLVFVALAGVLALQRAPRFARTLLLGLAAAAAPIAPWQLAVAGQIADYNAANPPNLPPADIAWGNMVWRQDALDRLRTLPAFQQGPVFGFVTDTLRTRGKYEVQATDLDVVVEAYGCWPKPLPTPFVCLYGGLNFFLANTPEADGGFSNAALDRAPPLLGGDGKYPPGLRNVLPRGGNLALSYPPHLDAVLHGYGKGFAELAADPLGAVGRIGKKLAIATQGALGGLGSSAAPIGASGVRRAVDLTAADGAVAWLWRLALLGLAAAGWWRLRREAWLWPWLAVGAARLAVVAGYFGYARQGALLAPFVAIGIAAAWPKVGRRTVLGLAAVVLLFDLGGWLADWATSSRPYVDGTPWRPDAPISHATHRIEWR